MKIDPISNQNIINNYPTSKPAPVKNERVSASLDEVAFSDEAISFSKLMAEARDEIEQRTPEEAERIEQIKTAIRQGTYKIDSEKIAESILRTITGD